MSVTSYNDITNAFKKLPKQFRRVVKTFYLIASDKPDEKVMKENFGKLFFLLKLNSVIIPHLAPQVFQEREILKLDLQLANVSEQFFPESKERISNNLEQITKKLEEHAHWVSVEWYKLFFFLVENGDFGKNKNEKIFDFLKMINPHQEIEEVITPETPIDRLVGDLIMEREKEIKFITLMEVVNFQTEEMIGDIDPIELKKIKLLQKKVSFDTG